MRRTKKIALGCGICVLIAVLLLAAVGLMLYYGFKSTDAAISPKLDLFFAAIEEGTLDQSYEAETTAAYRSVATKEQHTAIGSAIRLRLGDLESKSLQSFKLNQKNATTTLDVVYGAVFEKGTGKILASYEKQDGVWKVNSFRVESPLFQQDQLAGACPSCGEPHSGCAEYCPSCGEPLSSEPPDGTAGEPKSSDDDSALNAGEA